MQLAPLSGMAEEEPMKIEEVREDSQRHRSFFSRMHEDLFGVQFKMWLMICELSRLCCMFTCEYLGCLCGSRLDHPER